MTLEEDNLFGYTEPDGLSGSFGLFGLSCLFGCSDYLSQATKQTK
jgi:hypothetical protein